MISSPMKDDEAIMIRTVHAWQGAAGRSMAGLSAYATSQPCLSSPAKPPRRLLFNILSLLWLWLTTTLYSWSITKFRKDDARFPPAGRD